MSEKRELTQCDECKSWFDKTTNYVMDTVYFTYPKHWFWMAILTGQKHEHKSVELCSWLCTKNFVDREYSEHHPEDREYGEKTSYFDHQLIESRDEESERTEGCTNRCCYRRVYRDLDELGVCRFP